MSTTYSEWTTQIGDAWIAGFKRVEEALTSAQTTASDAAAKLDLPEVEVPARFTKLSDAISAQLPEPAEVIEANFDLSSRLLEAQRDIALKLVSASVAAAAPKKPAARKAATPKA